MRITNETIKEGAGILLKESVGFEFLGPLDNNLSNTLGFIEDEKYLANLSSNKNISGVFVTKELSLKITDRTTTKIICDEPRYYFYLLFNYLAKKNYKKKPSLIHPSATIHPSAFISDYNVQIGENVVIGPHVAILSDVIVGNNCVVKAGTVLGCDDAEEKRTSRGLLHIFHDGMLIIGDQTEIGANCTIDKGFSYKNTVIGNGTKIANTAYIAHSVHVGNGCLICACKICGSAVIHDNVRINPGAVIKDQITVGEGAVVSIGSVVVRSVPANQKVTGNFAIEHKKFIYEHAKRMIDP
ncbi:hypothetical protein A2276_06045 [candidate division WOR-1 bacterium RIFOXYA12_FULL_43_27]|uniref:UDP-3-O-[3-hydroxymyristoyl] glucosamine N-acyltransferase non-repeat region domain-containing protein n=1 Tax=candidate division WOR-1 bacterium RIFOXYC2_FULL_46_14 TaxID=1802587 RepID=A0A1F4U3A6_UNCSA|nr:MAG: hypothetical protein A2276_06045 [candidate division WOR-1 bacterium RIFOXYA12_FULL_43_27]OGC20219.1 MAG: hypothetical protein A2292_04045 [candidate division WOR-1 bacterium RIFOXYB2_FULL_46_45]OGC32042.1 MAG: hypothetical protein A2232_07400 [candidate division WOR-1 bacterium RIFOXYA2_FULL_46_56]OGC39444.1 MAG: hypothetical protein A2438_07765 [candidate division WOR-1 bacterium RIFOXYC2_FULL_46_14]